MGILKASGARHLVDVLRPMLLPSLRQFDFIVALVVAIGVGAQVYRRPEGLSPLVALVGDVSGLVLGVVLAGAAIQAAFMDESFLRKVALIDRDPVRYLQPFLFTATLAALTLCLAFPATLLANSGCLPDLGSALVAFVAGLAGVWAVLSVIPCLAMLTQFVGLKAEAAQVPDDGSSGGSTL